MKKIVAHIITVIILLSLSSCELIVDLVTNDSVDTLEYTIDHPLTELSLNSDMDIELTESDEKVIIIDGPAAILDNLSIENNEGHLSIEFDKVGSWMYDKPIVQLRIPTLCKINLYYDNRLTSADTLYTDVIKIHSEGTGDVSLKVNCDSLYIFGDNISDFYFSGKTNNLEVETALACSFYGANLLSNNVTSIISGSNNQIVYPIELLECNISQTGNIYYVNKPTKIQQNILENGTGQVIFDANRKY